MKRAIVISLILINNLIAGSQTNNAKGVNHVEAIKKNEYMRMRISVNGKKAQGVLYNNHCSRDFAALLPLTVEMEDYNNTEKIVEIPSKLSIDGAPSGFDPTMGDLTYYEPWGNIALFYKDFAYSNGLVSLGKITNGLEAFQQKGTLKVTFELD